MAHTEDTKEYHYKRKFTKIVKTNKRCKSTSIPAESYNAIGRPH